MDVLLGAAGQVDRVGDPGRRRQRGPQRLRDRLGQLGHLQAGLGRHRGGDAAVPAAVAEHGDPAPAGGGTAQQRLGGVDQLARRADPLDARGRERGVDGGAVGRQGAGVRPDGAGPGAGAVDGERHHGLAGAHGGGRGAGEGAAVTEVLDVDGDELGGVVGGELGHEVGGVEIGLVAQRREPGEPQPLRRGEQPQFQREVAALGDEPDRAGGQRVGDKLEPPAGVQDAEAVGPEQHRSRGADALGEGGVALAGTRADDHDRAGAGGQGAGDDRVDGGGGDGDDHEVGRLGQLVQGPVGPPSQHRFARAVVDEERGPVRLAAQRSLGQPVAPLARVLRRADHRDGRRIEQDVDGAGAQRGGGGRNQHLKQ